MGKKRAPGATHKNAKTYKSSNRSVSFNDNNTPSIRIFFHPLSLKKKRMTKMNK